MEMFFALRSNGLVFAVVLTSRTAYHAYEWISIRDVVVYRGIRRVDLINENAKVTYPSP